MGDPTTIALNLTFLGTLAVGLVMFSGLFLVFVATLVIAGLGRLSAVTVMGLGRLLLGTGRRTAETLRTATTARSAAATGPRPPATVTKAAGPAKPARNEPALSPKWAAAVEQADHRAAARAKAQEAPKVKVSVRDLPSPAAAARDLTAVAPLVESATDPNGRDGTGPASFTKAAVPAANSLLDTGSLPSRPGGLLQPRHPVSNGRTRSPAQERKAG